MYISGSLPQNVGYDRSRYARSVNQFILHVLAKGLGCPDIRDSTTYVPCL